MELLRWASIGLYLAGAYITLSCPCDPLWACHRTEMLVINTALMLMVTTESFGFTKIAD